MGSERAGPQHSEPKRRVVATATLAARSESAASGARALQRRTVNLGAEAFVQASPLTVSATSDPAEREAARLGAWVARSSAPPADARASRTATPAAPSRPRVQ